MADIAGAPDFEAALGDLVDHLPGWWATDDPQSSITQVLTATGELLDAIAVLFEQPYLDQDLQAASQDGLQRNFAFAWGLQGEQLPSVLEQLREYIAARAAEDGTLLSLVATLTTLVDTPANNTGGPVLTFPLDGSGLVFPSDGTGLTMYEFAPGQGPAASIGLVFPADGSGLVFPIDPLSVASDNVIVNDGTIPLGAGPGLIFAANQFVEIIPDYANDRLTVKVQNWMTFDRGAFARAVQRFQPADWYPTRIVEFSSYS